MIPLVIKGYSGFSGSSNVLIDAGVIISFGKPEKLENPEQPEKFLYQQESLQISLNVTVSPPPGENKRGGGTGGILRNEHITRTRCHPP